MNRRILIGVSGGIAASKVPELIRGLRKKQYDVRVIMTPSALALISPEEMAAASGQKVYSNMFPGGFDYRTVLKNRSVEHVDLANSADLFVIVPATANTVAKLAAGIADDYVTTTALAATCPILVCPSMNVFMWKHPATQQNIIRLRQLGYHTFGPDSGMLACGYEGEGRLPETDAIEAEITRFISTATLLSGKKVVVTAGGTIEPIDGVRYIGNRSSGKMGVALAESCTRHGADVLLLRSVSSVVPRLSIPEKTFDTADSLQQLLQQELPSRDICIHAAAVSDFAVKKPRRGKLPSGKPLPLELEPRSKILDRMKSMHPGLYLVAFKAEYNLTDESLVRVAAGRLKSSGADMIIANDVGRKGTGFQSDENEVWIIPNYGTPTHVPRDSKQWIADVIVEHIAAELEKKGI